LCYVWQLRRGYLLYIALSINVQWVHDQQRSPMVFADTVTRKPQTAIRPLKYRIMSDGSKGGQWILVTTESTLLTEFLDSPTVNRVIISFLPWSFDTACSRVTYLIPSCPT